MAYDVKFVKGNYSGYEALTTKNASTIYFITDKKQIYIGNTLIAEGNAEANDAWKALYTFIGDGTLSTDSKNLIAAINEVDGHADANATAITTLNGADTVEGSVAKKIKDAIEALDVTDTAVSKQFVTAVSETDGKISVSRAALTADDIPTLTLAKISDNGTAAAANVATAAIVKDSSDTSLPTVAQVATFVKAQVADLEGAMHFVGVITRNEGETDAEAIARVVTAPSAGDVVVMSDNAKEYIYANSAWREVGDEGLYVQKSTTIAGVDLQDSITKTELLTALNVADGAQVNVLESVKVNGTALDITDKAVNVTVATGSANGTVAVNGADVAVKGLGSAAYTETTAYDPAGKAQELINALDTPEGGVTQAASAENGQLSLKIEEADGIITSISGSIAANTYDAYGSAEAEKTRATGVEGTLASLTTDAKTNLVAAINEVDSHADSALSQIGVASKPESAEGAGDAVEATGLNKRIETLETAVGSGGSVDTKIKNAIEKLDTTADVGIASVTDGIVTIKGSVKEVDGVIAQGAASDVTLAKVATTGKAEDVTIADVGSLIAATTVEGALAEIADNINTLEGAKTVEGSISKKIESEAKDAIYIAATGKTIADGIKDAQDAADEAKTQSVVTVVKQETADEGYAATYVVKQNGAQVGASINIPKDFLVKSGELKTCDTADTPVAGLAVGDKYLDFVVNTRDASETAEHIYLPVNDLFDSYTSGSEATDSVVITVNNSTNKITAAITDATISRAKIAAGFEADIKAVETALGTKTDGAYETVASQIKTQAKDAIYKAATKKYKLNNSDPAQYITQDAYDLLSEEAKANYTAEDVVAVSISGAISALETAIGEGGGVSQQITNAINKLDANVTGKNQDETISVQVVETDGKITAVNVTSSIKVDVIGATTDKTTADTINGAKNYAKDYTDTALTWGSFAAE